MNENHACLLCKNAKLDCVDSLTGRQIRLLLQAFGREFPPEALVGINPDSKIVLWRCVDCGFEFFDPVLAGNSLFYQCLESAAYYSPNRPEFKRTLRFAGQMRLANVLDVGCGAGDFLDLARAGVLKTFGLELNPTAAEKARRKGHVIFDQLLHQLPVDVQPGGFDLITLFQVLEHVPDPVGILNAAAARLRPGGYISLAVPSKAGSYRFIPWDPAQWPPHHISRWCLPDFKTLARQTNLRLIGSGGDLLLGSWLKQTLHLRHQLAAVLEQRPIPKPSTWPGLASWIYRKCGIKYIAPRWGNSIYAYFQKI